MNKRVQAFLDKMQEKELDGIIINNLKNVYYLTGFWGSNGTVFISRDRQVLVTDARYIIAAKQEVTGFEIFAERDELATIAKIAKDMGLSRIGFEDEVSVSYYHRMQTAFEGLELVPQTQFVEALRMIKDETEIATIRDRGVRADVDERNEKMQFKIRASQTQKIPYQLIVGDKEMEEQAVNVRRYGQKETETMPVDAFVELILADIANKSRVEK